MKVEHTLVGGEAEVTYAEAEYGVLYKISDYTLPAPDSIVLRTVAGFVSFSGYVWSDARKARRLPSGTIVTLTQE